MESVLGAVGGVLNGPLYVYYRRNRFFLTTSTSIVRLGQNEVPCLVVALVRLLPSLSNMS